MYDVVVVGGGPAGSAAARRCSSMGLSTLVLEKERLPRDKVCSGWVMGVAGQLIAAEYGEVPKEVLSTPSRHKGYVCHVPEAGAGYVEGESLISWRRDLDRWLLKKAEDAGAELWEEAWVSEVVEGSPCVVKLTREGVSAEVAGRFVIGADGANSHVRKSVFPEIDVTLSQAYQEWFEVDLPVERDCGHLIIGAEIAPFYGAAHYKGNLLVFETGARMGHVKEAARFVREALAREHQVALDASKAGGRNACVEPVLYSQLFDGSFKPARGNVLLTGDSAGLIMPVTGEGMGTGMLSGLAAAMAAGKALKKNLKAQEFYLDGIRGLVGTLQAPYEMVRQIRRQAANGPAALLEVTLSSWRSTLGMSRSVVESVEF